MLGYKIDYINKQGDFDTTFFAKPETNICLLSEQDERNSVLYLFMLSHPDDVFVGMCITTLDQYYGSVSHYGKN